MKIIKLVAAILSFLAWLVVVPISHFPIFQMRTEIELDVVITTIERISEWEVMTYLGMIRDLWDSGNQFLAICIIVFVLALPAVKYVMTFWEIIDRKVTLNFHKWLTKLVFVDIFLVSLLLLMSYNVEELRIEPLIGLYILIASVILNYVADFIHLKKK